MKTARKGRRDSYISIRSKLVAAVAMLLVASFMVVSSSYAWFTLSTAPEVKGITTTVGSNGNLEIALFTGVDGSSIAASEIGDGSKDQSEKNATWGNLVDLTTGYGLENIELYPARLNVSNKVINQSAPLRTPKYAADGRVEELEDTTIFGTYNTKSGQFSQYDPTTATEGEGNDKVVLQTPNGVRAIGSSTGLTPQQNDYRIAKSAINTAKNEANTLVEQSLAGDVGSKLASIAADHALNNGTGDYDLTVLEGMLTDLDQARAQVDVMILSFIKMQMAKAEEARSATEYNAFRSDFYDSEKNTDDTNLASWVAEYKDAEGKLEAMWTYRNYIKVAVDTALTAYNDETIDIKHATWNQTTNILNGLVDLTSVKINGFSPAEIKADLDGFASAVMSAAGNLTVEISEPQGTTGSKGVYIDFAHVCGNIEVTIAIESLKYASMTLTNVPAKMMTNVTGAPTVVLTGVLPEEPVKSGESVTTTLDSLYGYALDLVFRTNAAESKLRLQSTPTNRIYSGDTNEQTMGAGSCMIFNYTGAFDADDVKKLMSNIRVVFATAGTEDAGTILAVGGLDTENAKTETGYVYAPLKLYDTTTYTIDADKGFKAVNTLQFLAEDKADIIALPQNLATRVTAYVYLDGDSVDNSSVSASNDIRGRLNLQFSSSAPLIPMEYNPLKTPKTTETPAETTAETTANAEP